MVKLMRRAARSGIATPTSRLGLLVYWREAHASAASHRDRGHIARAMRSWAGPDARPWNAADRRRLDRYKQRSLEREEP